MSSKIIIIATLFFLIVSFSILFVIEAKNHDPDYKKSWSVVYFENPRDNSLDFVIENHQGEKIKYDYKVLVNDKKEIAGEIEVEKGAKQEISPILSDEKLEQGKVMIIISRKEMDYKIFKNIE